MHLHAFQQVSHLMQDPDEQLFQCLIDGVPTGHLDDIPCSRVFSPKESESDLTRPPLSIHLDNWQSSRDRPELTDELVQEEIEKGFVEVFEGSLQDAQQRWPRGLAVGRLGIAMSDSRPPRLVVDSSVCGTNSNCTVREHQALPTAKDVVRGFPLRNSSAELGGFSLDVKSAHKRIVVRESDRGLLSFYHRNKLHVYRVCPFGAIFSAHWGRLGSFLVRFLHMAVYISHALWLYVDDFLFCQRWDILPLSAAYICILFQFFGVPISWKKCDIAKAITWIGWHFHFSAGYVTFDPDKRAKLRRLIGNLVQHRTLHKKDLERFIGLAMWLTQLFPAMRPLLQYFYADLFSAPATSYSIDPGNWQALFSHLREDLTFVSQPPGTGIPIGVFSVRHQPVTNLSELGQVRLSERRIWMRILNPSSNKRSLSSASRRCLHLFDQWCKYMPPIRCMRPKPTWPGYSAADACASGNSCQIGGFVEVSSNYVPLVFRTF